MKRLVLLLLIWSLSLCAHAHKPSDSYLTLSVSGENITGQWDIALRDLDFALGLDANGDAEITWGEVKGRHAEIAAYALARLQLSSNGATCPLQATGHLIDDHTDGAYEVLRFTARCNGNIHALQATYRLFFDIDPQHKGLLRLAYAGASTAGVFSPEKAAQTFTLNAPSRTSQFLDYGKEGVWHIWIGFDHILFLLSLLLPAVVFRPPGKPVWEPVPAFRPAFYSVLKIVTAFTVAHSITLSLATLGIVSLPSRWVESTIAASVVIAALNNIFPIFAERRWAMAFAFGLIHGFGFASVLSDLGLPRDALVLALVGFNLGVEVGQLAIVAAFLPVAYAIRASVFYRRVVLIGGSLVIAAIAATWLVERVFDMKLLPF
ncbi:HupE/UreJ family protein [Oxalobacteraceae bacterium OM1]|nr:HupE/UreJ family protein [Oxalobacteraceae bacterium OM1]